MRHLSAGILVALLFLAPVTAMANDVETVLQSTRPAGVVFEIIGSDPAMLETSLPQLKRDMERLRSAFPDLPVAVVSHGREQFALTRSNLSRYSKSHSLVKQLVNQKQITFHVCGTHASWYNVSAEDFPEYVDVSPTGPTQINDYEELGYTLIVIDDQYYNTAR